MNADEQAVRCLVAQWHSATATGDVGTVLGLMAEDVVFLVPGQPPMKAESVPPSKVAIKLDFVKPFEAHNNVEFTLEPKEDVTNVTHGPWRAIGLSLQN